MKTKDLKRKQKAQPGGSLKPVGSAMFRCTGCRVTGTWKEWKSSWEPGTHQCDVCAAYGRKAKLVLITPNAAGEPQPRKPRM